jgi:hypothetical protein
MAKKTNSTKSLRRVAAAPDQVKVTAIQAERLAALSEVDVREIHGLTVAELSEKLRWRIDPRLFFFRRICGKVVKENPATGIEYPVAYATVHVEDTDCSLLGYFPVVSPWAWYFPFRCRREVIATVKTDKCGNFCVYVPRWDIDWILRWRRERICFPVIFERPSLADLLDHLIVREPIPFLPKPDPDPGPLLQLNRGRLLSSVEQQLGKGTARKLGTALGRFSFGAKSVEATALLQGDAFGTPLPPPLPEEFRALDHGTGTEGNARSSRLTMEGVRSTLGSRLHLDDDLLESLDLRRFVGPFRRCYDFVVPEWTPIFDVPDITFRVTQDVNGDGIEETIYSEGYFQVRWNAGDLPNVKLVASPIAISIPECGEIIDIPCGNLPEIVRAGFMPVRGDLSMYDPTAGYAVRPNRPHPTGNPSDPLPKTAAQSPFHGTLPIYGCVNVGTPATQYRILDSYSADGMTFTPFLPILQQAWWLTRLDASGTITEYSHVVPDSNGWYPIVIPKGTNPNDWEPPNLLIEWDTTTAGKGKHILKIELGSGGVAIMPQPVTDTVAFHVDNAAPVTTFAVEYRKNGLGPFLPLVFPCPVVRRGAVPQSLEFRVTFTAAASHLRDVRLDGNGCGAGDLVYTSGAPADWFPNAPSNATQISHWHETVNDNVATVTAFFQLAATALQGTYSFGAWAASRALNPAGGDNGNLQTPPYEYNPADVYTTPSFDFSVIDAD